MRSIGILKVCGVAAIAVTAACRDERPSSPTGPRPALGAVQPRDGAALAVRPPAPRPPSPNEIVIARTLVRRGAPTPGQRGLAAAARAEQTVRLRGDRLGATGGTLAPFAAVAATSDPVQTAQAILDRGLLGPIQVGARPAIAICSNARPWTRTRQVGGVTVVLRGVGDVPYTELSIAHAGRSIGTVRARWVRLRDSWRLVSQEAATADGALVDTYAVTRPRGADLARETPLPMRACGGSEVAIVPAPAEASILGLAAVPADVGAFSSLGVSTALALTTCEITDEQIEDPCRALAFDLVEKGALVAATALAAAAVCLYAPPPVNVALCAGAIATYTASSAALAAAKERYDRCRRNAREALVAACCGTAGEATLRAFGDDAAAVAREEISCENAPPPAPPAGGGGGGSGGGSGCVEYCSYTDYYDGEGNYLYSDLNECWTECAI